MADPDLYIAYNAPMPTTAATAAVTTGTAIKTLLQVAAPATRVITICAWGIAFDGIAAAAPIRCELIETNVAATVTAHVAAGVMPYTDPNAPASLVTLGTAATGYTATAEGATTTTRLFDNQPVSPMGNYEMWWPQGQEPQVAISRFLRIRVTAAAAVNAVCWALWRET